MIADLIKANRSCRRFDEKHSISTANLLDLVDLARLSPSAANLQPMRYILSCDPATNAKIFECLTWAYYLKQWPGPAPGERPGAYIVLLHDTRISKTLDCDHGIAAQSILLGAREMGLAGCMLAAVKRSKLRRLLNIATPMKIKLVLAMGKPKETIVIDTVNEEGDIRYWRDENQVHHVPKRRLKDIVLTSYPI
ncbi:MAG: nitroreductase family protein [Desulfobacteraceae bacterium]|jgi:nitroreductase